MRWSFPRQGEAAPPSPASDLPAWETDAFLESYVHWREASDAVRAAYELWRDAQQRERRLAYAAYRAALDREEHSALMFDELVIRMGGRLAHSSG